MAIRRLATRCTAPAWLGLLLLFVATTASAAVTRLPDMPPPQDVPYPGTIQLHVDASDTSQGIFQVHEEIPVSPGELTLLYPKWVPGGHGPDGVVYRMAGLKLHANGKRLQWQRDEFDPWVFHVTVPEGADILKVDFQFLSWRGKRSAMTDRMLMLEWHKMLLYPAGYFARQIPVAASVTLPAGWHPGTALEVASKDDDTFHFKTESLYVVADSPIYAGKHFKRLDLNPGGKVAVHANLVADKPAYMEPSPEQLEKLRALVTQAFRLFDSHHFRHYEFLVSLSDHLMPNGMEHQESSENGVATTYFSDWDKNMPGRDLLAHEFTHSWNGKFRRPAHAWIPNYNVAMGNHLMWVYEGLTQYWGYVLTARSGMWTFDEFAQALAITAAKYDRNRPGLSWTTVEDTTNDPKVQPRAPLPWRSWQMSEEYYGAGQMIWLGVDARIRKMTGGKKSLDDFARAFFGVDNGSTVTRTYTFDDVVAALNDVVAHDWASYLKARAQGWNPPLTSGLADAGWKLVYKDTPSAYEKAYMADDPPARHRYNFAWSIGITLGEDGHIADVRWNGPAFKAGIGSSDRLVAVNDKVFSREALKTAIREAADSKTPIRLQLEYQGRFRTVALDYHEGLQYPHLVRIESAPDYLRAIAAPLD